MNPREQDNKLESLNYFRMPQKVPTKCCGSSLRSRPPYLSEESEADESRTYHRDLAWGGGGARRGLFRRRSRGGGFGIRSLGGRGQQAGPQEAGQGV